MTSPPAPKIELTALLSSASARVREAEKRQEVEKAIKGARTAAVRMEAVQHLAALDWRTTGVVYRYTQWSCACGNAGQSPGTVFAHQEHTRIANTTRLQAFGSGTPWPDERTPRWHKADTQDVPFCDVCMLTDLGFARPMPERRTAPIVSDRRGEFSREWDTFRAPAPDAADSIDTQPGEL